jgi:ubiquinone/menaquinone biosynthesis C-methylase UbiE
MKILMTSGVPMAIHRQPIGRDGRPCPRRICFTFDNVFRKLFHNPRKILGPYVSPGWTVLDLGPGIGYFTIPLAERVGARGLVIAADVQQPMLDGLSRRAERRGVAERIRLHLCSPACVGVADPVDFILMFWMLHEVRDQDRLFRELLGILKPAGRVLVVEPRLHVTAERFERSLIAADSAGFAVADRPRVALSRAAVLTIG